MGQNLANHIECDDQKDNIRTYWVHLLAPFRQRRYSAIPVSTAAVDKPEMVYWVVVPSGRTFAAWTFSSIVPTVKNLHFKVSAKSCMRIVRIYLYSYTNFFCPSLQTRAAACLSLAGFQSPSKRTRRFAPIRLRPQPPAEVVWKKSIMHGMQQALPNWTGPS